MLQVISNTHHSQSRTRNASSASSTGINTKNNANKTGLWNILKDAAKPVSWDVNIEQLKSEAANTYATKLLLLLVLRSWGPGFVKYVSSQFPNNSFFPLPSEIDTSNAKFNLTAFADEFFQDAVEAPFIYFLAPFMVPVLSRAFAKSFGIDDWRIAGKTMKKLREREKAGEMLEYITDATKKNEKKGIFLTKNLVNKVAHLKFFTVFTSTLMGMMFYALMPFIKNLFTLKVFNESNPYAIQGMETKRTPQDITNQNNSIRQMSLERIKNTILGFATAIGAVAALTFMKGKNGKRGLLSADLMRKITTKIDSGRDFGLSKVAAFAIISQALWAYLAASRPVYNDDNNNTNNPEKAEIYKRVYFAVGTSIFLTSFAKRAFVNIAVARKYNKLLPKHLRFNFNTPWKELSKYNQFLDIQPIHTKRIESLKGYKALSPEKQEELKVSLKTFQEKTVFYPMLSISLFINLLNYFITFKKNNMQQHHNVSYLPGSDLDTSDMPNDIANSALKNLSLSTV